MTLSLLTSSQLLSIGVSVANAADVQKGKEWSSICAACHGVTGIGKQDVWPNLAGQEAGHVTVQLQQYRTGSRKNAAMEAVAKLLTDEEIGNLTAYIAQQAPSKPQLLNKPVAEVTNEKREVD